MPTTLTIPVGFLSTNCYFYYEGQTGLLIDPGESAKIIIERLAATGAVPTMILLTHGHFDHIGAAKELSAHYKIPIAVGKEDLDLLQDTALSHGTGERYQITPDLLLNEGDSVGEGALALQVLYTPGHTKGGVCYYATGTLFCGDTLFYHECGRCDLYGGNYGRMLASLARLSELPGDTRCYPGHGEPGVIADERENNRYMKESLEK